MLAMTIDKLWGLGKSSGQEDRRASRVATGRNQDSNQPPPGTNGIYEYNPSCRPGMSISVNTASMSGRHGKDRDHLGEIAGFQHQEARLLKTVYDAETD